MNQLRVVISSLLLGVISGCGGSESNNAVLSDDTLDPGASAFVQVPAFQGDVPFTRVLSIDLDPMISAAGLDRAYSGIMARDGESVIVNVEDNGGNVSGIIRMDTQSGEASWMFTDMSEDTRVLFDADNTPVAVLAVGCGDLSYASAQGIEPTDMSGIIPTGRCYSARPLVSADGSVALIGTYEAGDGTPFLSASAELHAYTFNTADLKTYPDVSMTVNEIDLAPRLLATTFQNGDFSDNGSLLLSQQWWEGSDDRGNVIRQVGGVLWDTSSGSWSVLGSAPDERGCRDTQKVSCVPDYDYVLSPDSTTQYAHVPTASIINEGVGPIVDFATFVNRTSTREPLSVVVENLDNGDGLTVNRDGSQLVFFASTDTNELEQGYTFYNQSTGQFISLNRSLRACFVQDENGNIIDPSDCEYTSVPATLTSNATSFSASGDHVLFRAISRFTADFRQASNGFLLDVNNAAMYTIPQDFSSDPDTLSGDANLLLGNTGFPDYDFLIGER